MDDTSSNDLLLIVAQAMEEIKSEQGTEFYMERSNRLLMLTGYESVLDDYLKKRTRNSWVFPSM